MHSKPTHSASEDVDSRWHGRTNL